MENDLRAVLEETLGPNHRVTRELDGGAMSRVFVAEDLVLEREIAVKVLAPELEAAVNADRFRSEVQRIARLQHPHIVPVLSTGVLTLPTGGELPYYTMPLIRGEALRDRLDREGPLSADTALRVLRDVAEALAHAHREGVVHRDIKPGNVLLAGSHALVTDFGVSKALNQAERGHGLTATGMTIGTPGYMAPEQVAGDPALDPRADLYSLGVVGYEMLAGRLPFRGESYHEMLTAQFRDQVEPLPKLRPGLPAGLVRMIERCLRHDPGSRYQTAEEVVAVLDDLKPSSRPDLVVARAGWPRSPWRIGAMLAGATLLGAALFLWQPGGDDTRGPSLNPASLRSLIVVPPNVFGASPQDTLESELLQHLAEDVGRDLRRVSGLVVLSHLSVLALLHRSATLTPREVGESLAVEHVLTFVARGHLPRLTITAQLIETATERPLWDHDFEAGRDSVDLLRLRSDIVGQTTTQLLGRAAALQADTSPDFWRPNPADAAFRDGQLAMQRRTREGLLEAAGHYEESLRIDSTHVRAAAGLSNALALLLSYGYRGPAPSYEIAERALAAAERAIRLAPDEARGYIARGYFTNLMLGPVARVRADYQQAMQLESTDTDFASWNAMLLLRENYPGPAITEATRAVDLDPESPGRHLALALAFLQNQRYAEAEAAARRTLELQPDIRRSQQIRGVALLEMGRARECAALELWPYQGVKAACLDEAGERARARRLVDSLVEVIRGRRAASEDYDDVIPAGELATYFAWRGMVNEARRYLQEAFRRSPVGVDPRILRSGMFDTLLRDPGFAAELQALQDAAWPQVAGAR